MSAEHERKPWKNFLYGTITILLFLFLIEGALSVVLYQKAGTEKFATIETLRKFKRLIIPRSFNLDVTNHNLTRSDSTPATNHAIAEESILSNKFIYQPWVEYRNGDFDGKYMDMAKGIRKSVPSYYGRTASDDTLDIYFFGGSTMFGFNVLDHETIPSRFLQLYAKKYPSGKPVRVVNLGTPTYYSYQELVQLSNLVYNGSRPDVLVFLDGINDFWFGTASYYRQSYFSYIFRQVFNRGLRSKGELRFVDSSEAMSKNPGYMSPREFNEGLVTNYIQNVDNIHRIAGMINAKAYFFCQPSPFYNYPNQKNDPMCFKDTLTRFDDIYPELEKRAGSIPSFTFLGNMLKDEQGYPFIDGLHYSPGFIQKVTREIFSVVEKEFR
jgi:lysophospholipase L1-like esterase